MSNRGKRKCYRCKKLKHNTEDLVDGCKKGYVSLCRDCIDDWYAKKYEGCIITTGEITLSTPCIMGVIKR